MRNNLQPWRKPYMIILSIITVVAIIVGLAYNVFRFTSSPLGRFFSFPLHESSEVVQSNNTISLGDTVTSINVVADIADIEIIYGDNVSVYYDYPEKIAPKVELKNSELVITQKNDRLFNDPQKYKLQIYIPQHSKIENASFDISMGNIEFDNFTATNFSCKSNMGNIELDNIKSDVFSLNANMGNIEVSHIDCGTVTADCDMGNIEIYGKANKITADCSMGNITIKTDNSDAVITADCDLGECTVNGSKIK